MYPIFQKEKNCVLLKQYLLKSIFGDPNRGVGGVLIAVVLYSRGIAK